MRRKLMALALSALVLVSVLPPGLAAQNARVIFESGAEDANGVFEVGVTVYDLTAWGIQFVVKYDPEVIQPVAASGQKADTFADFATKQTPWLDDIGTELDPETGLINFTYFVFPDNDAAAVNDDGDIVTGSEGLPIYSFRFKRLQDGDAGLSIATEAKGEPYQPSCPEGVIAMDVNGEVPVEIIFQEADKPSSGRSESFQPSAPTVPERDPEELLKDVVILKIGSHAAVARGNVTAIYRGERDVTAYAHDNRTFVPVRFVGERLGATVGWDNDAQAVTVEKDGHKISMAVGSSTYELDGETKTLDAPAEFTPSTDGNSRTMVPIRFVSEALGYQVEWDQARSLVVIAPRALNWDPKGTVEGQALDSAIAKLAMFSNFV